MKQIKSVLPMLAIIFLAARSEKLPAQQFIDNPSFQSRQLFIDRSGILYRWGDNGIKGETLDPIEVKHPYGRKWHKAAISHFETPIFIDEDSSLYSPDGSIFIFSDTIKPFKSFDGEIKWKDASAYGRSIALISTTGKLYFRGRLCKSHSALLAERYAAFDTLTLFPSPPDGTSWDDVAIGFEHFLALSTKGNIYGFGDNSYGQFGCGDTNIHIEPVQMRNPDVERGPRWKTIAAGRESSFSIDKDGNLYHSGSFWPCPKSLVGKKDLCIIRTVPTLIENPKGEKWADVRVGGSGQILGLTENGSLYTWGVMYHGVSPFGSEQSGDFISEPREVPIQDSVRKWIAIGVMETGSFVADENCRVFGWGINHAGELGVPSTVYGLDTPTIVQRFCQTSYVSPSVNPNVKSVISLLAVHPNPASRSVDIRFSLNENAEVRMDLLNILGKPIFTFERLRYGAGEHTITLPLSNITPGTYVTRLQTNGGIASATLVIK